MGTVNFYHLTQSSAPSVLANLLSRALDQGWRVLLRAPIPLMSALDTALWDANGFIPHGFAGSDYDDDQPILLGNIPSDGFDALALVASTEVDMGEIGAMQRVWVLFDAAHSDQVNAARSLWKTLANGHVHLQYWTEEGGKWAMKTAANAPGTRDLP